MSQERFLKVIAPPAGGFQRLVSRRDAPSGGMELGLPMAAAATLAVVVFLLRPEVRELPLPWEASRLTNQPSEGVGLQQVNGARSTPLPSSDPRVHLYWLQVSEMPARSVPEPPG
jgi:hypothetical protein